jgi:peroxiredoxin
MQAIDAAPAAPRERPTRRRPSNLISTLIVMAVTGALILAAAYLSDRGSGEPGTGGVTSVSVTGLATGTAPAVGQPAPGFTATTTDGKPVSLADFIGHPVWLTFGASWCQPCRAENPDVQATYAKFAAQGIVVVQVYMSEDAAAVADYASRVGISYSTVPDPDERLAAQYRILGIPSHFFIDAKGTLVKLRIGSLDPAAMEAAVREIMG